MDCLVNTGKKLSGLVIFILLTSSPLSFSSADIFDIGSYSFTTVRDRDKNTEGAILSMTQDSNGNLWFGTQSGLIQYDGYNFLFHTPDKKNAKAIAGEFINSLWADNEGRVWVGTLENGMSVYDPLTGDFTHYNHDNGTTGSISSDHVYDITGDEKGNIWIGTSKGLNYLAAGASEFTQFLYKSENPEDLNMQSLLLSDDGTLWAGTSNGLLYLKDTKKGLRKAFPDAGKEWPLHGASISALYQTEDGKIWVGTKKRGIYWFIPGSIWQKATISPVLNGRVANAWITDIVQISEHEIWASTLGHGVLVYDNRHGQIVRQIIHDSSIHTSINQNDIGSLLVDESGLVWVGTWGSGLNRYNAHAQAFRIFHHSLQDKKGLTRKFVHSIIELDNGHIWIGTSGNGVDIIDPEVGVVDGLRPVKEGEEGLQDGIIVSLAQSDANNVWIGTLKSGLYHYQLDKKQWANFTTAQGLKDNTVRQLHVHGDFLWVGTNNGVSQLNLKSEEIVNLNVWEQGKQKEFNASIYYIHSQSDGTLWVVSTLGLFVKDKNKEYLKEVFIQASNSKSSINIVNRLINYRDQIWIGTNEGVKRLLSWDGEQAKFESIDNKILDLEAPISDELLMDDNDFLWTNTSVINTETWQESRFDEADGVDVGSVWLGATAKTRDGTLLFGGTRGVLMVKPDLYEPWSYQPKVFIKNITVDDKAVTLAEMDTLTVPAGAKNFSVELVALDFSAPQALQYAYQLEGFDEDWRYTDASSRIKNFTNLSPGKYRLLVKATNRKGKWSPHEAQLSIIVLPFWWQTVWAKVLLVLVGLLFIALWHRRRVEKLAQQKQILEHTVAERTAELNNNSQLLVQQNEKLNVANQNIRLISEIGREVNASLDINRVFWTVYEHVSQLMDATIFGIGHYREAEQCIEINFALNRHVRYKPYRRSMANKQQLPVWCIEKQGAILIGDLERDISRYLGEGAFDLQQSCVGVLEDDSVSESAESMIYVPMIFKEQVYGYLTVQSYEKERYHLAHVDLLRSIAEFTVNAIVNAHEHRTLQETRELLKAEKERAELASRAKMDFLANMSHEIRTPMNSVLGFLALALEDERLSGDSQRYVRIAHSAADNLLQIMNDILDISKYESGKLSLEQRRFNLYALMADIKALFEVPAKDKGLSLQLRYEPSLPRYYVGDELRLRQVLLNLLSNAIKFTEQGYVHVSVAVGYKEEQLLFSVEDSGIGMTQESISHIFDCFTQADTSITRQYGGTGLGTTISKQLVELMGGRIWVKSQLGAGSAFYVELPLPSAGGEPPQRSVKESEQPTTASADALSVLVVEDIEQNAELIGIRLQQQGYQYQWVSDGVQAIAAVEAQAYDVILMDIQMPEMDGVTATRRIRALSQPWTKTVPIIALTASIFAEERNQCFEAGMNAVITKPIDFEELFVLMEETLVVKASSKKVLEAII